MNALPSCVGRRLVLAAVLLAAQWRVALSLLAPPLALSASAQSIPPESTEALLVSWRERFEREVDRRLDVPRVDQQPYLGLLAQALVDADADADANAAHAAWDAAGPQAFVLVDRSPQVQAAFIVLRTPTGGWFWLGATPVSTGKVGSFEHCRTPLGVFAHTLDNPDFRAEGSYNENHIRGYGRRGMRVFDFGWQIAERGWGVGGRSPMRLQMHATDPQRLERRLGAVTSQGCIRIPATLNVFLDQHGVLDADYERALAAGEPLWVVAPGRQLIPWPGRSLVVVDSGATLRPAWSRLPMPVAGLSRSQRWR